MRNQWNSRIRLEPTKWVGFDKNWNLEISVAQVGDLFAWYLYWTNSSTGGTVCWSWGDAPTARAAKTAAMKSYEKFLKERIK